ncbi:alpha/beta hydrolase family esterase [Metabacillus iocasae]|uniref:Poly(Hydroxyalkanoate) depolymerase family esterase n=1 Tax=Priestia iocasae TaxID=2291674 RepID=A0ABS2QVE9_9BACI|nr:PHB depolymerase family esterase [Metabacillus iocasae]MBM7703461.1 poly(hydroxyalkanoate) depolymerase family esterase [Metabacillus iocasae]
MSDSFTVHMYEGKKYMLYVPSNYERDKKLPLMVMLHGCTQNADDFATGTNMNVVAEENQFIVLYPEQHLSANPNKCWNWFDKHHQKRGVGEPALIAGMVKEVKRVYAIDENRVYVAGLSAGGAMSIVLGVTYPDVFSGIGVGAGLEYKAATSVTQALAAMMKGGPDPVAQGIKAYEAMGEFKKAMPIIIFQGSSDTVVAPINSDQVITQWATTNDLVENGKIDGWIHDKEVEIIHGEVPFGKNYTAYKYKSEDGTVLLEKYIIEEMGHAWSGGKEEGTYTDPTGIDASRMMWEFFDKIHD